jgi:hypothetical protein
MGLFLGFLGGLCAFAVTIDLNRKDAKTQRENLLNMKATEQRRKSKTQDPGRACS